jgi:hypothetical protein
MMLGFGVCKALPSRLVLNCGRFWCGLSWSTEVVRWHLGKGQKGQREVGKVFLGLPARTANEVVFGRAWLAGAEG